MADINLIVATNADKVTNDFNRLGNTVLSQVKKAQQLERGYKTLDVAFNKGQISAQKYARGITQIDKSIKMALTGQSQLAASTNRTAAAMDTMSAAQAVSTRRMGRGSVITQQAGYQVGDFLVQIQGGTNAFVAFGQQATQIAGTLTILGGKWVLIGSALGIIIPLMTALGAAFARTGTDASFLGDSLDTISPLLDSIASAASYLKEVFLDTANIIVNNIDRIIVYGLSLAGFFAGKFVVSFALANKAVLTLHGSLVRLGAMLMRLLPVAIFVAISELILQFVKLTKAAGGFGVAIGLLKDVAVEFFFNMPALIGLIPKAMSVAGAAMKSFFADAILDMTIKFQDFTWSVATGLNDLFNTQLTGARLVNTGTAGGDPLVVESIKALGELTQARLALNDAMSEANIPTDKLQELKDLMASLGDGTDIDVRDWDLFGGAQDDSATESALEKMKEELALMEELVGKSEEYKYVRESMGDEYDNLSAKSIAYYEGEYKRIQMAIEAEEDRKSIIDTVASSLTDGLTAMVEGTKSVKDAFKDMAREIIKQLWEIFVIKKITGAITGAFGGPASMAIPSNNPLAGMSGAQMLPPGYSGGGYTGNGSRSGGMDGEGGFLAMLHPRETVVDHAKGQSTGGDTINISQSFNFSANGDESVKKIIAQAAPQIAQMTQKSMMDQRRRGGAMKSTFG